MAFRPCDDSQPVYALLRHCFEFSTSLMSYYRYSSPCLISLLKFCRIFLLLGKKFIGIDLPFLFVYWLLGVLFRRSSIRVKRNCNLIASIFYNILDNFNNRLKCQAVWRLGNLSSSYKKSTIWIKKYYINTAKENSSWCQYLIFFPFITNIIESKNESLCSFPEWIGF